MGVKLILFGWPVGGHFVRVGCTLLFAVGAGPPHDGVRKARRLNLFHDLVDLSADGFETLNEIILPFVPTGTICFTFQANLFSRQRPLAFSRSRPIGGRSRLFAEVEFGFVGRQAEIKNPETV